jgi:hypothetical protein
MLKPPPLPRLHNPEGAVAALTQAYGRETVPMPRFMTASNSVASKQTRHVPCAQTALEVAILFRCYMSARTVMCAESASDLLALKASEDAELEAACAGRPPLDGSIPPRRASVTLLAHGFAASGVGARVALDALCHLASSPLAIGNPTLTASLVRMTALAGDDAQWYVDRVRNEALCSAPGDEPSRIEVAVRWWVVGAAQPRTEFFALDTGGSPDRALVRIQDALFSLREKHGAPLPIDIATHHPNAPMDAWARTTSRASQAFFSLMEGTPSVTQSARLASASEEESVSSASVFVRISDRARGPAGLSDQACFHGMVLCLASKTAEVAELCAKYPGGLPSVREAPDFWQAHADLCIHTCAVQPTRFRLESRVTLYAPGGRVGAPVRSPGSWVWRYDAAIVPIECVLESFMVVPCARDSMLPGNRALEGPFRDFFNRASRLFASRFGEEAQGVAGDAFERLPLSLPARGAGADPQAEAHERFAQAAFCIDMVSRRVTVGDAVSLFEAQNAPPELGRLMRSATLTWGMNTTLLEMADKCADAAECAQTPAQAEALEKEKDRLKRVADAALLVGVACAEKRKRTRSEEAVFCAAGLRGLLQAAGLRSGASTKLPPLEGAEPEQHFGFAHLVAKAVAPQRADDASVAHAAAAAAAAREKGAVASVGAAVCVLRASNAVTATTYLLVQVEGEDTLTCNRILPNGGCERVTAGTVLDTPVSVVMLLKQSKEGESAKLTLTTR